MSDQNLSPFRRRPRYCPPTARQSGAMILAGAFLILIGVTVIVFFTGRSLIFEQKTSANQVRSSIAEETAEAGLEWTIAQLNLNGNQKITTACAVIPAASATATDMTFRNRYLGLNAAGVYAGPFPSIATGCVNNGGTLTCSCPTSGTPTFGTTMGPTFSVTINQVPSNPNMFEISSAGCESTAKPCAPAAATTSDANATNRQIVSLIGTLAAAPAATLTASGLADFGSAAITLHNTNEATNGITVDAGGAISGKINATINTVPGTPTDSTLVANDTSLSGLSNTQMFQSYFGVTPTAYQNAPTTTQVTCSNPCDSQLQTLIAQGNSNFYITNNMYLSSGGILGTATSPVLLVVAGNMEVRNSTTINGLIYGAGGWNQSGGGSFTVNGAIILSGNYSNNATPTLAYDPNILAALNKVGQFARVPGSWRNF